MIGWSGISCLPLCSKWYSPTNGLLESLNLCEPPDSQYLSLDSNRISSRHLEDLDKVVHCHPFCFYYVPKDSSIVKSRVIRGDLTEIYCNHNAPIISHLFFLIILSCLGKSTVLLARLSEMRFTIMKRHLAHLLISIIQ